MLINLSSKTLLKIICFLVLLTPSTLQVQAQDKTNDNNLITATCKKTPNFALCVSTLKSDPGSWKADVGGLAYIVVEAAKAKSIAELKSIKELSRSSPILKKRLSDCLEGYGFILNDFIPEAEQAPPKFAIDGLKGVLENTTKCANIFQGLEAPLLETNKLVNDLSLIAISIISTLL